jgi:hypothetical protein
LLKSNDDSGAGQNSRLRFTVPADGVFVLAASSCCDNQFTGAGSDSGTYELTTSPAPPSIGSIAGRIVDALTGQPLPGNAPPFAFVGLLPCNGDDCFEVVNSQDTDGQGQFRFDRDFEGELLPVGTYQVSVSANEFQQAQTDPFEVGEGKDFRPSSNGRLIYRNYVLIATAKCW